MSNHLVSLVHSLQAARLVNQQLNQVDSLPINLHRLHLDLLCLKFETMNVYFVNLLFYHQLKYLKSI